MQTLQTLLCTETSTVMFDSFCLNVILKAAMCLQFYYLFFFDEIQADMLREIK